MGEPIGKREIFRKYPDVVDVPQLCEMLGGSRPVSKKTAYRMLNAGKIKAFRIGRSYRIPKVNVIRFLQKETPETINRFPSVEKLFYLFSASNFFMNSIKSSTP